MFKLLTEEEKKKVSGEYGARRGVIIMFSLTLVLVTGLIGLLPSYVLSSARHKELAERARVLNISFESSESEHEAWLSKINQKLRLLSPELDADRPSDFIEKVIEERGTGISISRFSWNKTDDGTVLSVDGVAATRQDLIAFEARISGSGHFSGVVLPVSDLARDRDIDFSITFSPMP